MFFIVANIFLVNFIPRSFALCAKYYLPQEPLTFVADDVIVPREVTLVVKPFQVLQPFVHRLGGALDPGVEALPPEAVVAGETFLKKVFEHKKGS